MLSATTTTKFCLPFAFFLRDRIFERGFSTKGEGRGTGLSLVKETVDAFHGTLRVESEPGIGSSFIITVAESANRQQ